MSSSSREGRATLRTLQHEMRTPLGQILGYAEILEEDAADADQDAMLPDIARIKQAARDLLQLVDSVFQSDEVASVSRPSPRTRGDASAGAAAGTDSRDGAAVLEGARVLIVDDQQANRELLARQLSPHGLRIEVVEGARQALHRIESGDFDLVLLDLMMPEMNGVEMLEVLRRSHSAAELPVIMVTALDSREDVVAALRAGANDYVTKPVDLPVVLARMETHVTLRRANLETASLARELAIRNGFIRRIFGRYVSDDIVDSLLEQPEGLELGGERRRVSVLICDLRGFALLTESLSPLDLVRLLNQYLGAMSDTILAHGGTIDEFIGDAVLAFFGAPLSAPDDADRAVACAQAMQLAMAGVNRAMVERGMPELAMGIGIATGEVVVGNVGSERRSKYTAVGSTVNLAARIESFTVGGEILICDTTLRAQGETLAVEEERQVHPKGFDKPVRIHRIASAALVADDTSSTDWLSLETPIVVAVQCVSAKAIEQGTRSARLLSLRRDTVELEMQLPDPPPDELLIRVGESDDAPSGFAKLVSTHEGRVRAVFSWVSPALREWFEATRQSEQGR